MNVPRQSIKWSREPIGSGGSHSLSLFLYLHTWILQSFQCFLLANNFYKDHFEPKVSYTNDQLKQPEFQRYLMPFFHGKVRVNKA